MERLIHFIYFYDGTIFVSFYFILILCKSVYDMTEITQLDIFTLWIRFLMPNYICVHMIKEKKTTFKYAFMEGTQVDVKFSAKFTCDRGLNMLHSISYKM